MLQEDTIEVSAVNTLTKLHQNVLTSCSDDFTGLWEVIKDVERAYPNLDPHEKKPRTLQILKELLEDKLIKAGQANGSDLDAWGLSFEEAVTRISREWDALGRDPNTGDIVWFVATKEGETKLHEGKEPNVYEKGPDKVKV